MKLVIQRVLEASVSVESKTISSIKKGYFVLVGVKKGDTKEQAGLLADKVAKMRLMADSEGKMNLSISEANGELLVVSQFTLYADTSGGNRPSFITAAVPAEAEPVYLHFVERLKILGVPVQTGKFGHYMEIKTVCDGPVTIIVES